MSNHARGLWGYTGRTESGAELTIQATGMGAPSAALVLADLAELGVRRAIRVGTCTAVGDLARLGDLLLPETVIASAGSSTAFGLTPGDSVSPNPTLATRLADVLNGRARPGPTASVDAIDSDQPAEGVAAVDLQTAALLARATQLGIEAAAVLIVSEHGDRHLEKDALESAAKRAGTAASQALSG